MLGRANKSETAESVKMYVVQSIISFIEYQFYQFYVIPPQDAGSTVVGDANAVPTVANTIEGCKENVVPCNAPATVGRNEAIISSPTENQSVEGQNTHLLLQQQQQSSMRSVAWLTHPYRPQKRTTGICLSTFCTY